MTNSTTTVSLVNRSLLSIGARATISSLTENSTEANAAKIFFSPVFTALARTARWGCLRREGPLSLLGAAAGTPENPSGATLPIPPQPFLYQYAVPADSLFVRGIQPFVPQQTGVPITTFNNSSAACLPDSGLISYRVAFTTDATNNPIEVILTNQSQAIGVWTTDDEIPSTWDSLFEQAFVSSLAAYLVPALSLNMPLMQMMIKSAELAIAQARVADGNETPVSQDRVPDWIQARSVGTTYGLNGAYGSLGYNPMVWPSTWGGAGIS